MSTTSYTCAVYLLSSFTKLRYKTNSSCRGDVQGSRVVFHNLMVDFREAPGMPCWPQGGRTPTKFIVLAVERYLNRHKYEQAKQETLRSDDENIVLYVSFGVSADTDAPAPKNSIEDSGAAYQPLHTLTADNGPQPVRQTNAKRGASDYVVLNLQRQQLICNPLRVWKTQYHQDS